MDTHGRYAVLSAASPRALRPTYKHQGGETLPWPEPRVLQPASYARHPLQGAHTAATPSAPWAISLSLILGCVTHSVMMGSINVAVPTMMTSLRADVTQIQWVLTAFMIARTVVMPTLGWLGGRLGNRRSDLSSLLVYLASLDALWPELESREHDRLPRVTRHERGLSDSPGYGHLARDLSARQTGHGHGDFHGLHVVWAGHRAIAWRAIWSST